MANITAGTNIFICTIVYHVYGICKKYIQPVIFSECICEVIWRFWRQKQSLAGISTCIPPYPVGCKYLSLPGIPAIGAKISYWMQLLITTWDICFWCQSPQLTSSYELISFHGHILILNTYHHTFITKYRVFHQLVWRYHITVYPIKYAHSYCTLICVGICGRLYINQWHIIQSCFITIIQMDVYKSLKHNKIRKYANRVHISRINLTNGFFIWDPLSTHWGRDKMADISQTILSFMTMYAFGFNFHWRLAIKVQTTLL